MNIFFNFFIEENLSKKTIGSLLGISPDRVRLWIKNYLLYGEAECKRGKPKKESFEEEMERLRAEEEGNSKKIEVINELKERFSLELLCKISGISKSTYYRAMKRKDKDNLKKKTKIYTSNAKGYTNIEEERLKI
ncbi:hypothetical protein SU69_01870 [Thermosipho melanesiensis]|nr:hypothetical protein [Thermosipho melanesiensis]APT73420.1 transposase [Thermosipho melanesiensis]OOC37361.1 hypothetical protein SU68_01880 [Thermosipho melanesiensis]OOC39723.1 hypothetical protein SU69_01870 [Thermosipho melanesiensis]OOC39828.1 hypothetical protein SU70_01865 [Thermosipho melanesiensis]OOC43756.1 hypothetical protein SU71_01855 [Thermosipho melanesiensis]